MRVRSRLATIGAIAMLIGVAALPAPSELGGTAATPAGSPAASPPALVRLWANRGGATDRYQAAGMTAPVLVRLRPDSRELPPGCDLVRLTRIVLGFLDAYNRGDRAALAAFFPPKASPTERGPDIFAWFSMPARPGHPDTWFDAYAPADVLPYVAARHAKHERLQARDIDLGVGSHPWIDGLVNVIQQADDIPPRVVGAKSAVNCARRWVLLWNLGDRPVIPDLSNPAATPGYG